MCEASYVLDFMYLLKICSDFFSDGLQGLIWVHHVVLTSTLQPSPWVKAYHSEESVENKSAFKDILHISPFSAPNELVEFVVMVTNHKLHEFSFHNKSIMFTLMYVLYHHLLAARTWRYHRYHSSCKHHCFLLFTFSVNAALLYLFCSNSIHCKLQ